MKILVSACLLGENCKYNGGNNKNENVIKLGKKQRKKVIHLKDGIRRAALKTGSQRSRKDQKATLPFMQNGKQINIPFAFMETRQPAAVCRR